MPSRMSEGKQITRYEGSENVIRVLVIVDERFMVETGERNPTALTNHVEKGGTVITD